MPDKCPICGSTVNKRMVTEKNQNKSIAVFCTNPHCYAQKQRQLTHFISKKAFDIDGLGTKLIEQLMAENLIKDPADIFKLEKDDLLPLERFAEKSAENLIKAIGEAKTITLPRFIYALGIQGVGEETAIDLANQFGRLDQLKTAGLEAIKAVENIGPIVAKSIYDFFRHKENLELLEKFDKLGVKVQAQKVKPKTSGPLAGKKIVVTGTLESMGREEAKAAIRQAGGDWVSTVSKNTDFVVAGSEPGSKYQKAKDLGIRILAEKEFVKIIK